MVELSKLNYRNVFQALPTFQSKNMKKCKKKKLLAKTLKKMMKKKILMKKKINSKTVQATVQDEDPTKAVEWLGLTRK